MKNVTLSFEEAMLTRARKYAASRGISLNNLIRQLVGQVIGEGKRTSLDDLFEIADKMKSKSGRKIQTGKTRTEKSWNREDLYDV